MRETTKSIVVLRHGELFLKGQNRHRFVRVLEDNLRRALAGLEPFELQRAQGRLFLECAPAAVPQAVERLAQVFGLSSLSVADAVDPPAIEALSAAAVARVRSLCTTAAPRSFKVETQRSDKSYPMTSVDVSRAVGAEIVAATGLAVDLHRPAVVVGVEIGTRRSFVFIDRVAAAGGLPTGCEGKVLLLLSGGIDSPVAGHLLQKRGCAVEAVYFHSPPHIGEHARDKVLQLAGRLTRNQPTVPVHVVRFTDIQCDVRDRAPREAAVVLYRRMMMRIACVIASRRSCPALATGESLGQVASQTLQNLACIEDAATLPVLRPLIAHDKSETTALARRIGTYAISILPHDDCCSLFVPRHPATRLSIARARQLEQRLDPALRDAAIDAAELLEVDG